MEFELRPIKNIFSVGNDCNYVLTHVESLAAVIPEHLDPFITFIRALNDGKAACFTTDYLDPNYRAIIGEFEKYVKELQNKFKISIINKWLSMFPSGLTTSRSLLGGMESMSWKVCITDSKKLETKDSLSRTKRIPPTEPFSIVVAWHSTLTAPRGSKP